MRILVAGATGALGRQIVPRLIAADHEVAGMTRTPAKLEALRMMGAADGSRARMTRSIPRRWSRCARCWTRSATSRRPWSRPTGRRGIVLRYGSLYGPGTGFDTDGEQLEMIRRRKLPVIGDGGGVWSFVHVEDAAEATVIAAERGKRGIYNIIDDHPAPVAEWLPVVASSIGAKPPRRVPRWLGRLLAGEAATVVMTEVRGGSNAKAKRELGWEPSHPSWCDSLGRTAA